MIRAMLDDKDKQWIDFIMATAGDSSKNARRDIVKLATLPNTLPLCGVK
jgi:hypothetical protein